MHIFFGLIFAAIIIEGIITYANTFFVNGKPQWQMIIGIVLGVLVAIAYNIDLFSIAGITMHYAALSWLGCALTGILLSRGSNYIFDFISTIVNIVDKYKSNTSA